MAMRDSNIIINNYVNYLKKYKINYANMTKEDATQILSNIWKEISLLK